jgi:DnaJ family protein A protein 5
MESENDKLDEEQTAEGAPEFNDADSSSKEVYAFYNHWTNFVTKMSFSWEDKYNPKDVPNRQVRRAIEKENKKFRDIEKKKYNDIVRQLAAYIRKRDPRVMKFEMQARVKKDDEDRKKLEIKLEAELKRKEKRELSRIALENNGEEVMRRAEERVGAFLLADYESDDDDNECNLAEDDIEDIKAQADYASLNVVESTPLEENDYDSGGGEGEKAELCEICNKNFKTKAQLLQHLNSKNHRKKEQEMGKKSKKNGKNNEKLSENGSKSGSNWKIRPEIVSQNSESESDHDNNEMMNGNEKKVDNEMLNKKEIGIMNKKDKKNKKKTESLFQFLSDDSDDDTDVNKKNSGNEVNEDYDSDNDKKKNSKGKTNNDEKESIIDYATASLRKLKIDKNNDESNINDDVTDKNIQDNIAEKLKNKYKKKEKLGYFGKSSLTEKPLLPVFDEALPVSILDENDVVTMKGPQRKKVKKISLRGF